ncbi:TetR/AcrR family transcriptional regulator [Kineosporia sp. J2-2]|uniref:TetR/AcrR family transcriptional regulator n=1 Tax=Kineosporia corallincola TaxID=2835133 RepID=A0ABS5TG71_9ACTN|nr:TetR/AcrR family transcriptional regulator [Kineosporia corallincola]MBT0769853.1 TetR/AcrR family transcriptional regulator [Kineosporia corallincola]
MSPEQPSPVIWERPEPDERRAAAPLPRAHLVQAAVRLADAEGLTAVSIRNVATALGIRPMRLYNHVAGKDDLLALMIDEVYAEVARDLPRASDPWRERALAVARATRRAVLRHPWAIDLLGGRPYLGPNTLEVSEATAAALSQAPGRGEPQALRVAVGLLSSYLLGALRREIGELRASADSGLDTHQWQVTLGPYLGRQLATGRLPMIERIVRAPDPDATQAFESEIALILDALGRG